MSKVAKMSVSKFGDSNRGGIRRPRAAILRSDDEISAEPLNLGAQLRWRATFKPLLNVYFPVAIVADVQSRRLDWILSPSPKSRHWSLELLKAGHH